ncbi:MAG: CDP-glycerol glycerophosphotransferase family protein [Candidatus Azambacteria bacterium]|nr:CDP-glycerol glycerophosphotransferase family protein [Candidatus Azambacteria bacterium]
MKTIFITAFHPFISKNILNTDVFKLLKARNDLKIILLVPESKSDFFKDNYGSDKVVVESIVEIPFLNSRLNNFFSKAALFFIYSHWTRRKRRDYLNANRSFYNLIKFHLFMVLTRILSGHKTINRIIRYFDWHYSPSNFFDKQFEAHKPDLVFSADVYNDFDQALIKEAKMRKIIVIGMIRSWDNNVSKGLMRFMPDKLIVNNEVIKKEAIQLHNYPEKNLIVAGLPQFDDYLKTPFHNRENFFGFLGGDPAKKTILFAPGSPENTDEAKLTVCRVLKEAKEKNILPANVQFLVSKHPQYPNDFQKLIGDKNFMIMTIGTRIKNVRKYTEISPEDSIQLADMLYYSDVLIWMASSICLDALVFDKPEIVVNFDGFENKPYWSSVRRFHDEDHMRSFLKTGGISIAKKPADIISFVKSYLENPKLNAEGREKARVEQLWRVDGKSGERIANFILSFV